MGHDDRREILERLEALERRLDRTRDERGGDDDRRRDRDRPRREGRLDRDRDGDRERDRRGDAFQEKRIIDTIVHLAAEQTARLIQDQQARERRRGDTECGERCEGDDRRDRDRRGGRDGGGEKRLVDLIVGLVSEHVQEIVAAELDRRFGPPDDHEHDHDHDECEAHGSEPPGDDDAAPADEEEQR